jgi:DNA-binding FadR family transcriptional regulator
LAESAIEESEVSDKMALRQIIEVAAAALAAEGEEGEETEAPGEEMADEAEGVREKALQIQALRNAK